ncbi:patatin-like phospholipase family protein [Halarcobacter sp.]|uniref:patatin-like phospholipase family protein n=1 Tax=Halarcobacter sp. TaxID=2321133 RepID=UPI003A8F7EBD
MEENQFEILINGLKALKDRHFYEEVFSEIEHIEKNELDNKQTFKLTKLKVECLYQNKQISFKVRFSNALELLYSLKKEDENNEPDYLCLIGAVFKRKYQINKNIKDLLKAIKYYHDAANIHEEDDGYGACNAIFLYKTLLYDFDKSLNQHEIKKYNRIISKIRRQAIENLDKKYLNGNEHSKWINRTYAELYFSEENYDKAKEYLNESTEYDTKHIENLKELDLSDNLKLTIKKALKIKVSEPRDKLITVEQMIRLYKYQIHEITNDDFVFLENIFENFIEKNKIRNITRSILIGKVGLALSGGGFRASFYHIGVLARLAELDMLKDIEVISTVSGGSIIGMMYYIRLKELLERKDNSSIEKNDYIELIEEMQKDFLKSVQKNIRMKAFVEYNPYIQTLTQKLGEIYQEEFYGNEVKLMKELYIKPNISNKNIDDFNPHFNSFEISNKVPILVVNSTCLNNGHNWRFTASGMGESQYMYDTTIDKNTIHHYTRYGQFNNEEFYNFTISEAVASSSCVPGLFDPIELENAYIENENIKLVDGGVYDNQGLASILDEECNIIICSDASGQFNDELEPSSCRLSIIPRINDALMNRSRDQEYELIKSMKDDNKINGLCILHLRQCFDVNEAFPFNHKKVNKYGDSKFYSKNLDIDVQEKLVKVRTDLDSFNDVEAYALMNSGYTMTSEWIDIIKQDQKVFDNYIAPNTYSWEFLKIRNKISSSKNWVLNKLDTSEHLFFKVNLLTSSIKLFGIITILILLFFYYYCDVVGYLYYILTGVGILAVGGIVLKNISEKYLYKVLKYVFKLILYPIGKFNIKFLNDKYLNDGKIE